MCDEEPRAEESDILLDDIEIEIIVGISPELIAEYSYKTISSLCPSQAVVTKSKSLRWILKLSRSQRWWLATYGFSQTSVVL